MACERRLLTSCATRAGLGDCHAATSNRRATQEIKNLRNSATGEQCAFGIADVFPIRAAATALNSITLAFHAVNSSRL